MTLPPASYFDGQVTLYGGDCLEVMRGLPENSVDSVVTDPPYHLTTGKNGGSGAASVNLESPYGRARIGTGNGSGGFMGKAWDGGDIAFQPATWAEVLRVLKPGGHLVAFGGTRTYHRMACAIEDAGFEIRDQIAWLYGTGFPKSRNLKDDWDGWGTALKPAVEPICLARKPLSEMTVAANVLRWGTGALNIDACRVEIDASERDVIDNRSGVGLGTIQCARAGRTEGKFKSAPAGRWPANLVHDGSPEVLAGFPDSSGGHWSGETPSLVGAQRKVGVEAFDQQSGSAARFFYSAKADADGRLGSKHPTIKPVDLMRWLVRLVTPLGGLVLDCFAGTGTSGEAALREGFRAVLVEREAEYQADIGRRMEHVYAPARQRRMTVAKAKGTVETPGPLFEEVAP